jgi:hypothetical protein
MYFFLYFERGRKVGSIRNVGTPNYEEEFEDTKGLPRSRKLKKDKQHNGRQKNHKRTNNDLKKHTSIDRVTQTLLKTAT